MWVAEAGNRPFGYDPHSYTSHHRQQLLQKSAKNLVMGSVVSFGQTLEPKRLKICQEMNFLWPFCQWEVVWHMWLSCVRCGILMLDHWNQKNTKTTKKLASYGLLPSVRKMGFTSHFIYLTLSHKACVLTLFNNSSLLNTTAPSAVIVNTQLWMLFTEGQELPKGLSEGPQGSEGGRPKAGRPESREVPSWGPREVPAPQWTSIQIVGHLLSLHKEL